MEATTAGARVAERCAVRSRECGEAPYGTASRARRWVLLEQPGAWGADALAASDLPPAVAAHLRALAATLPARVLLLRRPGGESRPGTERVLYAGVSGTDGGWLERIELGHVGDVLDVDLDGLAGATSVGGERVLDPLYLVCTNGKHDACCAEYGLPVARRLDEVVPGRVWECSHVGGDRFAGNLVCLPDGHFYGHLDPDSASLAVAAHEGGRLLLDHWRGRSSLPFAVQAAEALARRELGLDRLQGLRFETATRDGARHEVRFRRSDGAPVTAVVVVERTQPARPLTCGGRPAVAPTHRLVELVVGD